MSTTRDRPPVELQHASLWTCKRWTPAVHGELPEMWDRKQPVWIVACRHATPAHHKVGQRRAMVAMMLDRTNAEIARQLGVSVVTGTQ